MTLPRAAKPWVNLDMLKIDRQCENERNIEIVRRLSSAPRIPTNRLAKWCQQSKGK
jgi:hypothetical protein